MVSHPRRLLVFLLVLGTGSANADNSLYGGAFGDAMVTRYGQDQLNYLEPFVQSKAPPGKQPVQSLIDSFLKLYERGARPPLDLEALSYDVRGMGDAFLAHAEALYESGDYRQSAIALQSIADQYRQEHSAEVTLLAMRLALRGVDPKVPTALPLRASADMRFNQVLALSRDKAAGPAQAIKRLRSMAGDSALPPGAQQRAGIWAAQLALSSGDQKGGLESLGGIDSASGLLPEALLVWLRAETGPEPAVCAAIAAEIQRRIPDSNAYWEAREHLVRALQRASAGGQAGQIIADTGARLEEALRTLDQAIEAIGSGRSEPTPEWVDLLPPDYGARIDSLRQRQARLKRLSALLTRWRPYVEAYRARLQKGPVPFANEIRDLLEAAKEGSDREDAPAPDPAAIFRLELSNIIGFPHDEETAYRMFGGMAQWEFGAVYPRGWKPVREQATDSRRRRRGPAADTAPPGGLAAALGHARKLSAMTAAQLKKLPSFPYTGMAEQSDSILTRSARIVRDIAAAAPQIEQAVRDELVTGLRERRQSLQQWTVRFGHLAARQSSAGGGARGTKRFDLAQKLVLKPGQSLGAALAAIRGGFSEGQPSEAKPAALLSALERTERAGETAEIRAAALRQRAELIVNLVEAQLIPPSRDAVAHYQELLRSYRGQIDEADVSYQLARAQDLAGLLEASEDTLRDFAQRFPRDSRSTEVQFRLAELRFGFGDYDGARAAYEGVLKRGDDKYLDQAEYKLAWSLFKQGEHRLALPRFVAVIDRASDPAKAADRLTQERIKDAFRATALTFSYLDGPADIERYFAKGPKKAYVADLYAGLAQLYLDRERINDAARTWEALTKHYPNDQRAPALLAGVVQGARDEGLTRVALEMQEQYVVRYARDGDYWQQSTPEARAAIDTRMQPMLAEMARMYHVDAQQQKNAASRQKAIRYYAQYVATFPEDKDTPGNHFLLAEARYEDGDLVAALADYEAAAYRYGAHAKAAEAGYATLVASQQLVARAQGDEARKQELRALAGRSDRFAKAFPQDGRVELVLAKAGEDLLLLGESAEAAKIGETLIARKPEASIRRRAVLILAHGYFESGGFAKAETAYAEALTLKPDTRQVRELTDRLGLSVYRQAEAQRAAGDTKAAVAGFLRVARTAPGADSVPNAEIDAAALLLESQRWGEAIDVLERFAKNFPTHRLAADVPTRLAYAYENDRQYLKAADLLESISQAEPDDALARQTLWRSAELRDKGGRHDLTLATWERYLKRYPSPLEKASETRQLLADAAARAGDRATRDRWLAEIIDTHARGGAEATVRVAFLAARANVVFGDDRAAEFDALKLKLPLDKSLAAKRKALEQSLKWYDGAGRYGIAEVTTAATFKTAELYRRLAKDLMGSDRPSGLNQLEREQYDILLEEEAFPFEEKATQVHELNHQRLKDGVYDDWVRQSMAALAQLLASKYDRPVPELRYFVYEPPKPEPPPLLDKDGKPILGKDGKPIPQTPAAATSTNAAAGASAGAKNAK